MDEGRLEEGAAHAQPTYAHPVTAFFHVAFKVAAIAYYITCEMIMKGHFVTNVIIIALLIAADFWTVKNISGRLLVGLRWWNEVEEDGSSSWQFESLDQGQRAINNKDKGIFWSATYVTPLVWAVLIVIGMFRFVLDYLLIAILGMLLSGTNLYGYYKCSGEQRKKMEGMAQGMMQQGFMSAFNRFM